MACCGRVAESTVAAGREHGGWVFPTAPAAAPPCWHRPPACPTAQRSNHPPCRKRLRVSGCEATHCSSASALQTRLDACAVSEGGCSMG